MCSLTNLTHFEFYLRFLLFMHQHTIYLPISRLMSPTCKRFVHYRGYQISDRSHMYWVMILVHDTGCGSSLHTSISRPSKCKLLSFGNAHPATHSVSISSSVSLIFPRSGHVFMERRSYNIINSAYIYTYPILRTKRYTNDNNRQSELLDTNASMMQRHKPNY